jgi:hypothetical protein
VDGYDLHHREVSLEESKSIEQFKQDLVRTLPYFPNKNEVRDELLNQSISSVLFHYLHWASRIIPDRPRKVTVEPYLVDDHRWSEHEALILKLLKKANDGNDLTGHLSNKVLNRGYTTGDNIKAKDDTWIDKDQLLNTKGFHHLHLEPGKQNKNNLVLFAQISHGEFQAIALFDHSVFDDGISPSLERQRMRDIYNTLAIRGGAEGTGYISNPITASGHPIHIHGMTQHYTHVLNELDSKLNEREFMNYFFKKINSEAPKKPKLSWLIHGLDFGLYEKKSGVFLILKYGHI